MQLMVLPGMDGGSELSFRFRALLESGFDVDAVDYPHEPLSTEQLAERVVDCTQPGSVLIAESFSGLVAIEALRKAPDRYVAAILVCSFVVAPRSPAWRPFLRSPVFTRPPPRWAIRRWMVGADASAQSVTAVQKAIARVPASVLAARARAVFATDARPSLTKLTVPILSIRAREDRLVDPRAAPEAHSDITSTEIAGPHLALHCRPNACSKVIRDWLASRV